MEITPDGRATADRMLAGIRQVERSALDVLAKGERIRPARLDSAPGDH